MQLSGIPAFIHPWINGMTEVVQFASVSSMSDILPTYIYAHMHTHTISHKQAVQLAHIILRPAHTYTYTMPCTFTQ